MKAVGTENAWFSFKGVRNDEVGVRMLSMPTRPHPARKGRVIDIPGADGDMWQDEGGYKRIVIPIRLITQDNANIDNVNLWLSGNGDLIFGDEPERVYHARITKEFSRSNRSQRLRGQEFTVSFDCVDTSNDNRMLTATYPLAARWPIYTEGTVDALPLIRVGNSNGGCSITAGDTTLNVKYCPKPIYVDCAAKIAYMENDDGSYESASMYVSGDWLRIPPNASVIVITPLQNDAENDTGAGNNSATVNVTPRWRWL